METKHTPGPWEWVKGSDGIAFLKGGGLYVLSPEFSADDERVHVDTWLDVSDANAALIAAAPELLDCLHELTEVVGLTAFKYEAQRAVLQKSFDRARAAIAKAEAG